MTVIKDGTGQGFLAAVTSENKIAVDATTTPDGSESADKGFGFFIDGTTSIVAAAEKTVIVIINTGTSIYEIGRVLLSVQNQQPPATGVGTSTITTIKMYIGSVTATGGTSKTPINASTGSLNLATVSSLVNNPTISGTDNEIKQTYFLLNDSQLIDFEGSIILQPSGSFRITCTGGAGIAGGPLCAASIQFYQEI